MNKEIINKMIDFINNCSDNIISIYFETNYPHFSSGLAIKKNKKFFCWIESSSFFLSGFKEQYEFDSQGYGDMISIVSIDKDINKEELCLIAEDGDLFAMTSIKLYNNIEAIDFLNTFNSDSDLIDFVKTRFLSTIDFNKSQKIN